MRRPIHNFLASHTLLVVDGVVICIPAALSLLTSVLK